MRFGERSEAERRLLRAAINGDTACCGPNQDTSHQGNDPSNAGSWRSERQIRAELIQWLCTEPEAAQRANSRGVNVLAAKVTGDLDLSFTNMGFPLSLCHCYLVNDANLTYLTIPALSLRGTRTRSLRANGLSVKQDIRLDQGFVSTGDVFLQGAHIGGSLVCNAGSFRNPAHAALSADRITVGGSVFLKDGFRAEGEVRLPGAQIGSNLECDGGLFQNPGGQALIAERIKVEGSVFLRNGFSAEGIVTLLGARIEGTLDCEKGTFTNPGDVAFWADYVKVGAAYLRDGFRANGRVIFHGAEFARGLHCRQGTFSALNLNTAAIRGIFHWKNVDDAQSTHLDLRNASVDALEDEKASWPEHGSLHLDGFVYDRFSEGPTDAKSRLMWLARVQEFTLQPYQQLAKVLRESGDARGARQVLFEMEHRRRSREDNRWYQRAWGWILKMTIGYGHKSWRALSCLLGLIVLGLVLFGFGYLGGAMVPSDKDAYEAFEQRGEPPSYYPSFNALIYSVENAFPLVSLGVKDRWEPNPGIASTMPVLRCRALQAVGGFSLRNWHPCRIYASWVLRCWLWFQILAGWVLATLFVAGLAGVVKSG